MQAETYTSRPISLKLGSVQEITRIDIEFHGVRHSGASYEGRVFVDSEDASETTALDAENGYAGSFRVFGHGGCFGGEGHCTVTGDRSRYDPRSAHPLTPIKKVVTATDVLKEKAATDASVTLTVVPVITGFTDQCSVEDVFKCESIRVNSYRSEAKRAVP